MKFVFDLDDTLVAGDIVRDVSSKMLREDLIDRVYSNEDLTDYDLRDLPPAVKLRVTKAFADPEYVWTKKPIVGSYYFLHYLTAMNHEIGVVTARPATNKGETLRFMSARFPFIDFSLGIHVINSENQIDMKNIPSKKQKLEELNPDFYFDDNAEYCTQAFGLGIETFLVSNKQTPWNHAFAKELKATNSDITVIRNVAFFPATRLS